MTTATATPDTEVPTEVATVRLPTVILLRTPGYDDRTRAELRAAMTRRGWYISDFRADAWHLQRGGACVVLVDLHHRDGLDSDPITVGQVLARYGDDDDQIHELRLMTGSDQYPRLCRHDPHTINVMKRPGASVLDVGKVIGYIDEALAQKWRKTRDAPTTRG